MNADVTINGHEAIACWHLYSPRPVLLHPGAKRFKQQGFVVEIKIH